MEITNTEMAAAWEGEADHWVRDADRYDTAAAAIWQTFLDQGHVAATDRVLDVGCGTGDVSFLAARLVGPTGAVLGVDRSAETVEVAQGRARDAGLGNVSFVVQDLSEVTVAAPVDALVGRLVLMYLDDPGAALRRLLEGVRPGGVVAFQEMDMGAFTCEPDCALWTATGDRVVQTFARAGIDHRTG